VRRAATPLFALLLAWAVAACTPDCSPIAPGDRPNILFVTIDTLRADHLGSYGNTAIRTPHLDRLAEEGLVFERAWAASHVTLPSHVSLLSSLPVVEHGIVDHASPVVRPVRMLPAVFREAGYRTAAFASAVHLGPTRALGQLLAPGLDHFAVPRRVSKPFLAAETTDQVVAWVRGTCRSPFFAWVHYWDPHMPYTPPAPWHRAYYDDDPYAARHTSMADVRLDWFDYDLDGFRRRLAPFAGPVRALKHDLVASSREVKDLVLYADRLDRHTTAPAERAALRARLRSIGDRIRSDLPFRRHLTDWLTGVRDARFPIAEYAGEVSYTDVHLGRLLDELERLGIAGRTIVVVTADHGESLGEHAIWFNHIGLYEPVTRVPLIIRGPGRIPPGRRTDPASGLDVAPTILGLAGLPVPTEMRGRDLLRGTPPPAPIVTEAVRRVQTALVDDGWKLIRTERTVEFGGAVEHGAGTLELYDLTRDPGERDDRAAAEPDRARELAATLDAWLDRHRAAPAPPAPSVGKDRMDDLRALGYVE
jgi:arylsulfatase A-like enzyme